MVLLRHTVRRPDGHLFVSYDAEGNATEGETLKCPHCEMHTPFSPGSGRQRSWCFNCQANTCHKRQCIEHCTPFERVLEAYEGSQRAKRGIDAAIRRAWGL